jgi:hypothetical protein
MIYPKARKAYQYLENCQLWQTSCYQHDCLQAEAENGIAVLKLNKHLLEVQRFSQQNTGFVFVALFGLSCSRARVGWVCLWVGQFPRRVCF